MVKCDMASLPSGTRARIVTILGGLGLSRRLMEMGFTPGAEIEIVNNSGGPILVRIRGVVIAVGRGVARRIIVETA